MNDKVFEKQVFLIDIVQMVKVVYTSKHMNGLGAIQNFKKLRPVISL